VPETYNPYERGDETLRRLRAVGLTYVRGPEDNKFDCCVHMIFSHADGKTFDWQGSWWAEASVRQLWDWAKANYPVDDTPYVKPPVRMARGRLPGASQ